MIPKNSERYEIMSLNTSWDRDLTILLQLTFTENDLSFLVDDVTLFINQVSKVTHFTTSSVKESLSA